MTCDLDDRYRNRHVRNRGRDRNVNRWRRAYRPTSVTVNSDCGLTNLNKSVASLAIFRPAGVPVSRRPPEPLSVRGRWSVSAGGLVARMRLSEAPGSRVVVRL